MSVRVVVKFGGSALDIPDAAAQFARSITSLVTRGIQPLVVHGGGKTLSGWMERIGLTPRFVEGLRYTDGATLELAQMVLSGKTNKDLVALLCRVGGKALGLSGSDAALLTPVRVSSPSGADIGFVGEIERVATTPLEALLELGFIPVISSIAHDKTGQAYNINADHVAAEIARALTVHDLILLTDVDGVLVDKKLVSKLSVSEARDLLAGSSITGGMRPKIEYAVRAVSGGVAQAHIINAAAPEALTSALSGGAIYGTVISA